MVRNIANPFFPEVLSGAEEGASQGHHDLATSGLLDPPLATIRPDGREMGRVLMRQLLRRGPAG